MLIYPSSSRPRYLSSMANTHFPAIFDFLTSEATVYQHVEEEPEDDNNKNAVGK